MEVSVLIQGLDEEERLPRLFAPLKDIKDIVFIDHQSTDKTAKLAKKLGARVYTREFISDTVVEEDITDFKDRFGYEPLFKVGEKIGNAKRERTTIQKLCKNDWILNLDCDEVIKWNYKKVLKSIEHLDVVNCRFYHEHNPDGTRTGDWVQTTKLYNRIKTFWICRIHECLNSYNARVGFSDDMEIDHYPKFREYKKKYMNILEYAVLRDQDLRAFYYLGVEYHHWHEWEKTIKILTLYLKEAFYMPEKVQAYIMIADSLWNLGREDEAYIYAMQGLKLNSKSRKVWDFLIKISPMKEREDWLNHAKISEVDHLL